MPIKIPKAAGKNALFRMSEMLKLRILQTRANYNTEK